MLNGRTVLFNDALGLFLFMVMWIGKMDKDHRNNEMKLVPVITRAGCSF